MNNILSILFLFILTGCLVQPDLPAENLSSPEHPVELINTQLPGPSTASEESEPSPPPAAQQPKGSKAEYDHLTLLEMAVRDLAIRLGVGLNEIYVISIQSIEWPDGGLGCPLPELDYAQVITPGYKIQLEVDGQVYTYHTNAELAFWLCLDGKPQLPLIPVVPGEIDDGIPWMPVDPIPTLADEILIADPDPGK